MNINTITIECALGMDAEFKSFASGTEIADMRVCFKTRKKSKEGEWSDVANWIDVTYFKPFEWMKPQLTKGRRLVLSGRLEIESWADKETGKPRSKARIIANDVLIVPSRHEESSVPLTPNSTPATEGTVPLDQGDSTPF